MNAQSISTARTAARGRGIDREGRFAMILIAMWELERKDGETWHGSKQIADAVGMKKTSHFMSLLNALERMGFIHMDTIPYRPNQSAHVWHMDSSVPFCKRFSSEFVLYRAFMSEVG